MTTPSQAPSASATPNSTPTTESAAQESAGQEAGPDLSQFESMLSNFEQELKATKSEAHGSKEQLERVKRAITGEDVPRPTEDQVDDQKYQSFLDAFNKAEREGRPMPITAQLTAMLIETRKNHRGELAKLRSELAAVKRTTDVVGTADYLSEGQAFNSMQDILTEGLKRLHGEINPYVEEAASKEILAEIGRLKKEEPKAWDEIRKNKRYQEALVSHVLNKHIPQKARELLKAEKEKNTPLTEEVLLKKFQEAKKIQDPKAREAAVKRIREDYWTMRYAGKRRA